MDSKYRQLLESFDEAGAYEFPSEFDYTALENDALDIERAIHAQYGLSTIFEGMTHNQDASFSIAIILSDHIQEDDRAIYRPSILFSNFGRLTTISWPELLPEQLPKKIISVLDENEFHYIPAEVMDAGYDGVMADDGTFHSWWHRYFDWI